MNALVEPLNQAAATWWTWTWQATAQGAILLVLVLVALALWRRATPPLRYGLLLLALVKFLLPPVVASSVGLFAWLPLGGLASDTPPQMMTTTVRSEGPAGGTLEGPDVAVAADAGGAPSPRLTVASWALMLQCLGSAAFLVFIALEARALHKRLRASRRLEDGPLARRVDTMARRMGLRRVPPIFLCPKVASPQSGGIIRPFVILPEWAETLEADEGDILIAHELAHVQRRDGLFNWFQAVAQAVLWWNPAVWWLNDRVRAERELCCDDLVLAHGVAEGQRYSHMLVNVAERLSSPRPALAVTGMADSFRHIDSRVRRALDPQPKRPRRMSFVSVVGLLALAACVLPGAPNDTEDDAATQSRQTDAIQAEGADHLMSNLEFTFEGLHADQFTFNANPLPKGDTSWVVSGHVQFVLTSDREGFEDIEISADQAELVHAELPEPRTSMTLAGNVRARREEFLISSDRAVIDWADKTMTFGESVVLMRGQDDALTGKTVVLTGKTVVLNLADGSLSVSDAFAESLRGLVEEKAQVQIEALLVEIDRDTEFSWRKPLDDTEKDKPLTLGLVENFKAIRAEVAELVAQGKATIRTNPKVVAVENKQVEITAGQEIPYIKSGETVYELVGTRITLKAHVVSSADNTSSVFLDMSMKIVELAGERNGVPVTNKREIETTFRVRPGQAAFLILPSLQEEERPLLLFLTAELFDPEDKTR